MKIFLGTMKWWLIISDQKSLPDRDSMPLHSRVYCVSVSVYERCACVEVRGWFSLSNVYPRDQIQMVRLEDSAFTLLSHLHSF